MSIGLMHWVGLRGVVWRRSVLRNRSVHDASDGLCNRGDDRKAVLVRERQSRNDKHEVSVPMTL